MELTIVWLRHFFFLTIGIQCSITTSLVFLVPSLVISIKQVPVKYHRLFNGLYYIYSSPSYIANLRTETLVEKSTYKVEILIYANQSLQFSKATQFIVFYIFLRWIKWWKHVMEHLAMRSQCDGMQVAPARLLTTNWNIIHDVIVI